LSTWAFIRETLRYYVVKGALLAMYLGLRCRLMLGLKVDEEELEDFDLDVTHHDNIVQEV